MGLSAGATVLIGQAWDAREPDRMTAVAGTTLTVALLLPWRSPPAARVMCVLQMSYYLLVWRKRAIQRLI